MNPEKVLTESTRSPVSTPTVSLTKVSLSSRILSPRVADRQAVLCPPLPAASVPAMPVPAAPVPAMHVPAASVPAMPVPAIPVPAALFLLDGLLEVLKEEKKQVTAHINETHNTSMNVCVRYFDIGKEKQEIDEANEQKAWNDHDDKCMKREPRKQAKRTKNGKKARNRLSTLSSTKGL
jgi:hypothetical protein